MLVGSKQWEKCCLTQTSMGGGGRDVPSGQNGMSEGHSLKKAAVSMGLTLFPLWKKIWKIKFFTIFIFCQIKTLG